MFALRYRQRGAVSRLHPRKNAGRTPPLAMTPYTELPNLHLSTVRPLPSTTRTGEAYGRFIGRIGALAVALGVGAAIASCPGIAAADDGGSTTSQGSSLGSRDPPIPAQRRRQAPLSESGTADSSSPPIGSSTVSAAGTNSARSFRSSHFGQTPDRSIRSRLSQTRRHPSSSGSSSAKDQQPAARAGRGGEQR